MAPTRTTIRGRVVNCSAPCNAVPATSQDSSAVADNPVLDKIVKTSADLGVCHTNADKKSEQSEAQKMDSNQHGVDVAETSRLVKEDVPSQPTKISTTNISSSSSTLPNNPPYSDIQAMLKFMMERSDNERKEREKERKERLDKEERDRQERERERRERLEKEEHERHERRKELEERRNRRDQEFEEKLKQINQERDRRHKEYMERKEKENKEFLERMRRICGVESVENKAVITMTSESKSEPEIKPEESIVSEKTSELESGQTNLDPKDSPWDGPQDKVLVRDVAINSAEKMANECADKVCCEALDGFTSLDDSVDSNLILVGGNRSTPEPESRLDATIFENPSASGPSWIFQSPESGEMVRNPDFKSHIGEAQLCDDFFRNSLPMVFMVKNRSVTVTKIGVVQYLGENPTSFSATQCSIPYNDDVYGFCYDSVRSASSCGSCREQKSGSVWSPSLSDVDKVFRTVKSENLRRGAGNQYYPVSTMKSSVVTGQGPRCDAVAEFRQNPVFQVARWSMKLKLAKRTLKFTPMVWSLVSKCSTYRAIGVYHSRVAMLPQYLTQPPGCQRVVIWSFKLEFGIT